MPESGICRSRRAVAVAAFAMLSLLVQEARAQSSCAPWLTISSERLAHWDMDTGAGCGERIYHIRPRWTDDVTYRILALLPFPGTPYDTAVDRFLLVFQDRGVAAELTLFHFGEVDARTRAEVLASHRAYDLVLAVGSDSVDLARAELTGSDTPVVTMCAKDPVLRGQLSAGATGSGTNIAYTSLDIPIETQIYYLKRFRPALERVAVIYDAGNQSAVETQVRPLLQAAPEARLDVIEVAVDAGRPAGEELARKVAGTTARILARDPEAARSVYWITGSTRVLRELGAIALHAGRIPVLGVPRDAVHAGDDSALLSIGVSFQQNAHMAADYALRILRGGEDAATLPVGRISPPEIALNLGQARRRGLRIPFHCFELASAIYDLDGELVLAFGRMIPRKGP